MAMLEVKDINVYYGLIHALRDVSFEVNEGEVVALIGANGAGKTTTLHTVTGLLPSKGGTVMFEGKDITHKPGHAIVKLGMSHVPEGRRVFAGLTVAENLRMGAYTRPKNEIPESLKMVYERFPRLEERKNQAAGTLSGGEQQMLAVGRALMSKPRILLLNKWDLLDVPARAELADAFPHAIPVSARTGDGLKRLLEVLENMLLSTQQSQLLIPFEEDGPVLQ